MVAEGEEDTDSEQESAIVEETPDFSKTLSEAMVIDNADFMFTDLNGIDIRNN
jgi:hypothetical protein